MSVTSTGFFVSYLGDGSNPTFAFPFYLRAAGDLQVYVDGVLQSIAVDYNTTGTEDDWGSFQNGGNAVFIAGHIPTAGAVVLLIRQTPKVQNVTFVDQGPFLAGDINHALDWMELQIQESPLSQFIGVLPADPAGPNNVGDWYIVVPSIPGGPWARVATAAGTPATWNDFAMISLQGDAVKKTLLLAIVFFSLVTSVYAQSVTDSVDLSVQACSGGNTQTFALTTFGNTGIPNRLCAFISNTHATLPVRCGDVLTDATHGQPVPAGQTWTICIPAAIYCCGVGGAVTVTRIRTDR